MNPKSLSPSLIFSVLIFFFFFLSHCPPKSVSADDVHYTTCNTSSQCGELGKIEYPFWLHGSQPHYCGRPELMLDCRGAKATIEIMSEDYRVININQKTQILRIARMNELMGTCPNRSTSLDSTLLSYSANVVNATILYDCWSYEDLAGSSKLSCMLDKIRRIAYFVINTTVANELESVCGVRVVLPVLASAAQGFMNKSLDLDGVLGEGFEVEWGLEEGGCGECVEYGGRCGFDWNADRPVCYCRDQPHPTSCYVNPSSGISLSSSNDFILLSCGWPCCQIKIKLIDGMISWES